MGHEGTTLCAESYQFIGQQIGFHATNAVALYARHCIEGPTEVEKRLARGFSIVANVYARDNNLFTTLGSSLFGLAHQVGYRSVARKATRIRNGAIGTEVVATVLHL